MRAFLNLFFVLFSLQSPTSYHNFGKFQFGGVAGELEIDGVKVFNGTMGIEFNIHVDGLEVPFVQQSSINYVGFSNLIVGVAVVFVVIQGDDGRNMAGVVFGHDGGACHDGPSGGGGGGGRGYGGDSGGYGVALLDPGFDLGVVFSVSVIVPVLFVFPCFAWSFGY